MSITISAGVVTKNSNGYKASGGLLLLSAASQLVHDSLGTKLVPGALLYNPTLSIESTLDDMMLSTLKSR